MVPLDPASRHHRQSILPCIGADGQQRLREARVWIVGCGALGCASADQLVRAGVGSLLLIDRDVVELTNLQRQTLFSESDLDRPKAIAARDRLAAIDGGIELEAVTGDCTPAMIERLLEQWGRPSLILDGTDNFQTRYLLNDAAVREAIPLVYGGVIATRAMAMAVRPGHGPCLRCISDQPPPSGSMETCDTAGVLGAAVQVAASMQVVEVLRSLLDQAEGSWLVEQDVWTRGHRRIDMTCASKDDCPCCVLRQFDHLETHSSGDSLTLCGRGAVQVAPADLASGNTKLDLGQLAARLSLHGSVTVADGMLRVELVSEQADEQGDEPGRAISLLVFEDARAIVRGTSRTDRARTIYARYIGS